MQKKYLIPVVAMSVFGMSNIDAARVSRDQRDQMDCEPMPPATCYPDDCRNCYCLGPENYGVNAPACPLTCNGDFTITIAGFYWNTHQDGMEYAIEDHVTNPRVNDTIIDEFTADPNILALNNLVDAEFQTPGFEWDWGFKLGLGYCTTCDGWDLGILWTWYRGRANDHIETEFDDNFTLLPLWSAFAPAQGSVLYATDIETHWQLKLNIVDLELGRNFWTSRYLAIRPFMGIRIAYVDQTYEILNKGGSWSERTAIPLQVPLNNRVYMTNNYKGAGMRAGLNSTWHVGCGWALYGNWAASIIYGRFSESYDETNRQADFVHGKFKIAAFDYSFRASRAILDLEIGVKYATMFCDCQYGFSIALGWENHMFFDQNQFWRINRVGDLAGGVSPVDGQGIPNNQGENVFFQRRGDLDTQGWTLTAKFDF